MRLPKLLIAILTAGLLAMALGGVASATPDTEQAKLTAADAAAGDQFRFFRLRQWRYGRDRRHRGR